MNVGQKERTALRARGHRHSSLAIHPYFGKVDPAIVSEALNAFSSPGDVVLDPFCGSGTVLHDALLAGRHAIGYDSSPLGCLIATAKILGITAQEERGLLDLAAEIRAEPDLFSGAAAEAPAAQVPLMPRIRAISDWFNPNALSELSVIKQALERARPLQSPETALLALLSFSRIITAASKQKGESIYSRVEKDDSPGRVLTLFADSVRQVVRSTRSFNEELRSRGFPEPAAGRLNRLRDGWQVSQGKCSARVHTADSRSNIDAGEQPRANLVVTSPPYLMSWDYGLYHKFRFYWLGFDLDQYEETEIGRHLRRKDDDVERYESDMGQVFASLHRLTAPHATAVLVNAPSVVYGKLVDTNDLLARCAAGCKWEPISSHHSLDIPGPHHGMYASLPARGANAPGRPGKKEHVLVFRRM